MPTDEQDEKPLTPIFPFNQPGEAIELYSGPIGGLGDEALNGTIRLVPYPTPTLRWQVELSKSEEPQPLMDQVGGEFELGAGGMVGRGLTSGASFDSLTGISSSLECGSGGSLDRVLVHWMNLPDYIGNGRLRHVSSNSTSWTVGRLTLEIEGWSIVLDGRPDNSSLFENDTGLARYVLTHVMELRRTDGCAFDVESARSVLDALRLSLSFAAGRWVAPTLTSGFDAAGQEAWRWWVQPICGPYERTGAPIISPKIPADMTAFLKASVARLLREGAANTIRFQMQLATQTSNLGFVENRILSAFPAIENLSWETFVLGGLVPAEEFEVTRIWPTARRLRELLVRAGIPVAVDAERLPALHELSQEKRFDGPGAVAWVRNRLIHPTDPDDRLYSREPLVVEAWLQSREYVCLLLLHAIGYNGGYLPAIPPFGFVSAATAVPWTAQDVERDAT